MSDSSACRIGFGRKTINPDLGISLGGHFHERPNTGVLDDLFVKVVLIQTGDVLTGVISYDLLLLSDTLLKRVRAALSRRGFAFAKTIPLCCTHTHTSPDLGENFDPAAKYPEYQKYVAKRTVEAVEAALADSAPAEILAGSVMDNPYAFNRRFWMKNGAVVTNPGMMNPDIVRPEGDVDREIAVLAFRRNGRIAGVIANIANHTDTIGGDKVSADWPGHMERTIQKKLGGEVLVMTLIRPSGNVNHFNVKDPTQRGYGYDISTGLGRNYARIVLEVLDKARPIGSADISLVTRSVTVRKRKFTDQEIADARAAAAMETGSAGGKTAEDLAKGDKTLEKFFAQQVLKYLEWMPQRGRKFDIAVLKFGSEIAIVFLPGEPFTEISACIRMFSPCRITLVASLTNGEAGYVAYKECFRRGGYETRVVVGGGPAEDTADLFIHTARELLNG